MKNNGERRFPALRAIATVLANLTAVLSANYIVFYILDHFNPNQHYVVHSGFFLTKYLHVVIPILMLLTALFYLLIYIGGGLRRRLLSKKRLIVILVVDVLVAGAFAMTVNVYTFDWLKLRNKTAEAPVAIATMPPKPTPEPTAIPTPEPTEAPTPEPVVTNAPTASGTEKCPVQETTPTPEPTEAPTPEPTPIPGLLGDKYREKFSEGEPVVTEPNTSETLADGTVKTLIYTYAGKSVAVELYHYKKGRLEYQIADLYVREIEKLTAAHVDSQSDARMLYDYARDLHAPIAVNSDYYATNAVGEGLIIRNGYLIRSNPCKNSDLCVIYQDGTVRCFDCKAETIDNNAILGSYPYHSFYFGPSLLDANGKAKTKFNSTIGGSNPRTAFGYYEPGHYAFICVLGDRNMKDINGRGLGEGKSPGLSLADLSALCASLGMQAAYNFDGGASSGMYWNEKLFGHNNRITGDVLAVVD